MKSLEERMDELEKKTLPNWEREEVVLLVVEYFRTLDLERAEICKSIAFLSRFLRNRAKILGWDVSDTFRNETGIEMKFGNIKSLDRKYTDKGYVGLKGVSKIERQVVEEYCADAKKLEAEAYRVLVRYYE